MSKENKTSDKQQNGNDFIADVICSSRERNPFFKKEVFNRFAKYSSGKTRAEVGLGLGLSVTLGETEALNGAIDFETKEGETTFIVKIPKVNEELMSLDSSESSNELFFDSFEDDDDSEMKEF